MTQRQGWISLAIAAMSNLSIQRDVPASRISQMALFLRAGHGIAQAAQGKACRTSTEAFSGLTRSAWGAPGRRRSQITKLDVRAERMRLGEDVAIPVIQADVVQELDSLLDEPIIGQPR